MYKSFNIPVTFFFSIDDILTSPFSLLSDYSQTSSSASHFLTNCFYGQQWKSLCSHNIVTWSSETWNRAIQNKASEVPSKSMDVKNTGFIHFFFFLSDWCFMPCPKIFNSNNAIQHYGERKSGNARGKLTTICILGQDLHTYSQHELDLNSLQPQWSEASGS